MIAESLICLALNVYHESKNQSFIGQVAVAQVVMNRVQDSRYPNNVCDVVKQGLTYKWKPTLPIKNKCNSVGTVMVKVINQENIRHGKMLYTWQMVYIMDT